MKILFVLLSISLLINSCNQKSELMQNENYILGIWKIAESTNSVSSDSKNEDPLLKDAKGIEVVKKGKILSIFPDKIFTEINGNGEYITGKWKWIIVGEKICFIKDKLKEIYDVKAEEIETKKIQIELSNKKVKNKFIQDAKLLEDFKEEPFYGENNLWRIKPIKSENKEQIKNRLGNYFKHMVYILKAADTRKLEVISFEFSMGIIQIYNGGIGIVDLNKIPEYWKNTYFNNEELNESHEMFNNYLRNNKFRGASTGNWVKDDYTILLSIYSDLKSSKF